MAIMETHPPWGLACQEVGYVRILHTLTCERKMQKFQTGNGAELVLMFQILYLLSLNFMAQDKIATESDEYWITDVFLLTPDTTFFLKGENGCFLFQDNFCALFCETSLP